MKAIIYGSLIGTLAGIPQIFSMIEGLGYAFSEHDHQAKVLRKVACILYRLSLGKNHRVFFMNRDDISYFKKLGIVRKENQAVLINGTGIDLNYFRPCAYPKQLAFLCMARFLRNKGVKEFVEAATILKRDHADVAFRIAGWIDDSPLSISKKELQQWINSEAIEYLGKLSDVRPAIANASVVVLPSYYREGIPRTLLEAMSMARPIITTDNPGCRNTVEDGKNGFLIRVKDVGAIVKSMKKFIDNPDIIPVMGMKSRQLAERRYDVNKVNSVILRTMGL